ncbi:MAG: polysaccharide deacetylase family protein [Kordiimonadaceae bacterium]|nr:polysaccharide deacetylase family protein [Kordiimonadaceae bacterium]
MPLFIVFLIIGAIHHVGIHPVVAQNASNTPPPSGDLSASVLLYHRFGENTLPTTNVRLEQFEDHLKQLKSGGYNFMRLEEASTRIKSRGMLPSRTVIITVDDAYKSVITEAWPRLKAAGIPMTLFVSTDPVDQQHSNYLTWDDIRTLKREGVEIGHHTASHLHMPHAGLEAAIADVRRASARFKEELGEVPTLFAYPYGEYTEALRQAIKAEGFTAAFGQFSGPMGQSENPYSLPRFPVNERYGNDARFKLISQTIALPVADLIPNTPEIVEGRNPPLFGFTVDRSVRGLKALACYPSHLGKAAELHYPAPNRIEVRFDKAFPKGRNRINCTMPAGKGRWYWLGRFFYVPGGKLD